MAAATNNEQPLLAGYEHTISLPAFEGPLDLLLFLIRRQEIDIYDIPIERITRQYLEVLRSMEHQRLEIAGDFFVMAATLMHIKSRLLLPKDERIHEEQEGEEEVDPRWELVQQLIQYRKYKEAAADLQACIDEAQQAWFRKVASSPRGPGERPLQPMDAVQLWNVFNQVLRRLSERITIGQIHDETVTIADRMEDILRTLQRRERFHFSEFLTEGVNVSFVVASFLALLELNRLDKVHLRQDDLFADILCERCGNNVT
ncbi:MAG: segregation/condensation protein A [Verrucomicrobia bacterium]|jgi:segregation and condensation protein A|nr:segregation/condensation protein A [Verrucomicrobiota bacterium]